MRLSRNIVAPCGVLAVLALVAGPASAHLSLTSPPPRTDSLKKGPCGAGPGDARGPTVATFKPGETITVTWDEYIDHPGHFRIAFDADGQDDFFDPASFEDVSGGPGVLMDGIADKKGGDYSVEVTLPAVECDNCVLQVIQVMTDKKPYGDGNDLYYQCADIALVGEVGTSGEPGTTGEGTTSTSGGPDSSGTAGPGSEGSATGSDPTGGPVTSGPVTSDGPPDETGAMTGGAGSTGEGAATETTGAGGTDGAGEESGCGCRGGAEGGLGWLALGLLPLALRRRRG